MRTKPFLLASTLAIILSLSAAPAEAQFYGGSSVGVGIGRGYVTVGNTPWVTPGPVYAPTVPYYYAVPGQSVLVRPVPPPMVIQPQPYGVYRPGPGWGPRPYDPYGPRRPGPPPFVYGRRGWW